FARLAQSLAEKHQARIVLLGTKEEQPLGRSFYRHLDKNFSPPPATVIDLMGRTSIEELGGVLAGLDLLVTTDTGTMHLAAAVNTPILALFIGPAFCHETGPYGPGHLILQVETDCSPCTENKIACEDHFCRRLIKPETAAKAANMLLNANETPLPGPLEPGDQVRLLVSEFDGFGVIYRPLVPYPLDQTEALALAYRETGRSFIRPYYDTNKESFIRNITAFSPPDRTDIKRLVLVLSEWKKLLPLNNSGSQALYRLDMTAGIGPDLEPLRRIILGLAGQNKINLARRLLIKMIETLSMVQEARLRIQTQGNDYCQNRARNAAGNRPV
ncbi:MAG: glycosyltransferase family 9 protein, partial [Thermodesulfobacteriota bacterium]|nr:glycosyltransferase family 9 protein [Thermodesulfobacteriota bacterium]